MIQQFLKDIKMFFTEAPFEFLILHWIFLIVLIIAIIKIAIEGVE